MKNRRSHPYYDWDRLMSYYPQGYRIFISVGEGGTGKTFSALKLCKSKLDKNPNRKMLLVRDAENVLDAFNSEDGKATLEKHFCKGNESIKLEKDDIWLCDNEILDKTDRDGNVYESEKVIPKRHLGSMSALSTFYKAKGIERANNGYDVIFIDEFIQESRQADRVDTVRAFYRTLQSTLRTNPDAVVLMAANLVNDTPLWNILGVKPGEPGEITTNASSGVVIEHLLPSEDWVKKHKASVAGRLGIGDYNTGRAINPNVRKAHKSKGFEVKKVCYNLTNDGSIEVYVFDARISKFDNNRYTEENFKYVTTKDTGEEIVQQNKDRGISPIRISRTTTFGFQRRPKSNFDNFGTLVNDLVFESDKTLDRFQIIVK